MPTQQQVYNTVLTGQLLQANLIETNRLDLVAGILEVKWGQINKIGRFLSAVYRQYILGDNSSANFLIVYDCLLGMIGSYGLNTIDPNAQVPGQTTVTVPVLQAFNTGKLPFNTAGPGLTLANYNNTYLPIYGNNPIVALVDNAGNPLYVEDKQTPPQYTYTNDDPNQPLLSIFWDLPFAAAGYVQISGVAPAGASGSTPSSTGSYQLNFTQADLLDAGGGNYYLPLVLPSNRNPVYVSVNGVGQPAGNYDKTFTPSRLFGFANNAAQTIIVTVI